MSLAYTFDKSAANEPSRHKTQYFEMMGDRAIYHDGWIASTTPLRSPWNLIGAVTDNPAAFKRELTQARKTPQSPTTSPRPTR